MFQVNGVRDGPSYAATEKVFYDSHMSYGTASTCGPPSVLRTPRWTPTPPNTDTRRKALENTLERFVPTIISPLKMAQIYLASLLLKCVVGDSDFVLYVSAASGNASAGAVPFRLTFEKLHVVSDDAQGLLLQLSRKPFVKPRKPLPFGGVVHYGRLDDLTHWDLCAVLLDGGRGAASYMRVSFFKQRHTLVGGDLFLVHGDDTTVASSISVFNDESVDAPAPGDESSACADHGVDWDEDILPKQSRCGSAKSSTGHSSGSGSLLKAALPCPETSVFTEHAPSLFGLFESLNEDHVALQLEDVDSDAEELLADIDDGDLPAPGSTESPGPVGSSSASSSSGHVAFEPRLVFEQFGHVNVLKTLISHERAEMICKLTDFRVNGRWELFQRSFSETAHIAKIRAIGGASLRVDCRMHKSVVVDGQAKPCKFHININCKFEEAQCELVRWVVFGVSCSGQEHLAMADSRARAWRNAAG
jgi:hypothetical protein